LHLTEHSGVDRTTIHKWEIEQYSQQGGRCERTFLCRTY